MLINHSLNIILVNDLWKFKGDQCLEVGDLWVWQSKRVLGGSWTDKCRPRFGDKWLSTQCRMTNKSVIDRSHPHKI